RRPEPGRVPGRLLRGGRPGAFRPVAGPPPGRAVPPPGWVGPGARPIFGATPPPAATAAAAPHAALSSERHRDAGPPRSAPGASLAARVGQVGPAAPAGGALAPGGLGRRPPPPAG